MAIYFVHEELKRAYMFNSTVTPNSIFFLASILYILCEMSIWRFYAFVDKGEKPWLVLDSEVVRVGSIFCSFKCKFLRLLVSVMMRRFLVAWSISLPRRRLWGTQNAENTEDRLRFSHCKFNEIWKYNHPSHEIGLLFPSLLLSSSTYNKIWLIFTPEKFAENSRKIVGKCWNYTPILLSMQTLPSCTTLIKIVARFRIWTCTPNSFSLIWPRPCSKASRYNNDRTKWATHARI